MQQPSPQYESEKYVEVAKIEPWNVEPANYEIVAAHQKLCKLMNLKKLSKNNLKRLNSMNLK